MHNSKTIVILTLVLLAVGAMTAMAADAPRYQGADLNRQMQQFRIAGADLQDDAGATRVTWGQQTAVGAVPPGSPGYRIGETTYDYQHNGSTGRQIDVFGTLIQATWMKGLLPFSTGNRTTNWNKIGVNGSATITLDNGEMIDVLTLDGNVGSAEGTAVISGVRPGYTTYRNRPNGRAATFVHDAPEDTGLSFFTIAADQSAFGGVFLSNPAPQPPGIEAGGEVIWPHGTIDIVGTDTIIHVVARGSGTGDYDPVYYWRGDLNGTAATWEAPVYFDSVATISQIIEADPNSDRVAALYTRTINKDYTAGTAQVYNDLILRESTNGGVTWSSQIFVTSQDTLDEGYFPYTDIDAVYDEENKLHITYNTREYTIQDGDTEPSLINVPARIWHRSYNSAGAFSTARQIQVLDTNNVCNEEHNSFLNGSWNLLMSKMNLTVKPAGVGPVGNTVEEVLYAVWVQAGPTETDCATQSDSITPGGMVNAELWCSASSDDGTTWDRPVNITGTTSDSCMPGDCLSEHWVTAAARADSGIYLSYVMDTHAGGIVGGPTGGPSEGAWSVSPYMIYVPKARVPVSEPRISVTPGSFEEQHVNPGGAGSVEITVSNLGNANLTYTINVTADNDGQTHVVVENLTTYVGAIAAAAASDVLTIDFDGIGLPNPSEHDWRLEVTSNDAANDPGQGGTPLDISLNVFVADPWFTCVRDSVGNTARTVSVSSCLAVGDQGSGGGLGNRANTDEEWLFEASPVLTYNGGASRSWVDMFWAGVVDRSRDSNRAFRAQSGITQQFGVQNPDGDTTLTANIATGQASTTDSTFLIDWEVRTFNDPGYTDGFVAKYDVSGYNVAIPNGVLQLGATADLDIDSLSAWNDGIANESKMYVGARGGYGDDTTAYTPQNKWGALFYVALDSACDNQGEGGQVMDNPTYVYPEGNWNRDSLRIRMAGIIGWNEANFPADSVSDLNVLMKNGEVVYTGSETASFAFGVAVSDVSIADLEDKIGKLRSAINSGCVSGCLIEVAGDVNVSGALTSADIIYLVNFVFKGQAAPLPCAINGDVNCNGSVTSADIIYMVNHVFKGQAGPCDICNDSPQGASCT